MAFELKYHFKKDNTVVISHIHGGNIRAADDSDDAISNDGGKGKWAQWFCELQGDDVKYIHLFSQTQMTYFISVLLLLHVFYIFYRKLN